MTRPRRALGLFTAYLALSACARSSSSTVDAATEVSTGSVSIAASSTATSTSTSIRLFATGDVGGEVEPCGCKMRPLGGVARRTKLVSEAVTARSSSTIVLDAGDHFFATPAIGSSEVQAASHNAEVLAASLRKMNAAAAAVGERDLALGVTRLRKLGLEAGVRFIAANLVHTRTGTPAFDGFTIIERAGTRLGIVGVTLELEPGVPARDVFDREGLTIRPAPAALEDAARRARAAGARFVVALLHTGERRARELLAGLPHGLVDLAIAAHDRNTLVGLESINGCGLLSAGDQGKWVASVELGVVAGGLGIADLRAISEGRRSLDALDARIRDYEALDAGASSAGVESKLETDRVSTLARLRRRRASLANELLGASTSGKHTVSLELIPIDVALPEDEAIARLVRAH